MLGRRHRQSRVLMSLFVALLSSVLVAPAAGAGSHEVVYPTGVFPADVDNVQAAVDQGGTVVLKATDTTGVPTAFDFGSSDHEGTGAEVRLTTDVEIRGETVGPTTTTITGGWLPLFGIEKTHTVVEGLNFVGQGLSAMVFIRSSGAVVRNNRVAGVVGTPLPHPPFPVDFFEGRGIKFLGNADPAAAITGRVIVADNVIEDMHADFSDAIVFDQVAADIEITGNSTDVTQSSGVLMIGGSGSVRIADNHFVVQPGPDFLFGNGIAILGGAESYRIEDNRIVADDFLAEGIFLLGLDLPWAGAIDRLVLHRNDVTLTNSVFGGITLQGDISGAVGASNRVVGDATFGFDLLAAAESPHHNRFSDLDLSSFDAVVANVFLDGGTRANTITGDLGQTIDLGTRNRLVDLDALPGPPTSPFADSRRALREDKVSMLTQAVTTSSLVSDHP